MKILVTTPNNAAVAELGKRLARIRKQRGYTQQQLAKEAGLGVATLRRIEDGKDAQIGSWVKLLKALGLVSAIDGLLPENFSSPMTEVKQAGKRQYRKQPADSQNHSVSEGSIVWGDEK